MPYAVHQKLILFVEGETIVPAWITVSTLQELEADGRLVRTTMEATQAATLIDAISKGSP